MEGFDEAWGGAGEVGFRAPGVRGAGGGVATTAVAGERYGSARKEEVPARFVPFD